MCRQASRMHHTLRLRSSQVAALLPVQAAVKAPDPRKELLYVCQCQRSTFHHHWLLNLGSAKKGQR